MKTNRTDVHRPQLINRSTVLPWLVAGLGCETLGEPLLALSMAWTLEYRQTLVSDAKSLFQL